MIHTGIVQYLSEIDTNIFLSFNGIHSPFWDYFMSSFTGKFIWIPMYATILYILLKNFHWKVVMCYVVRGSIQNVAWMKCKVKYVKPPVHRWLTNVTQYIWEENKKFRSFYFASVASIFIPVDCAVNRGNNERQIEKAKERLYVASVFRLKTKAIRSI